MGGEGGWREEVENGGLGRREVGGGFNREQRNPLMARSLSDHSELCLQQLDPDLHCLNPKAPSWMEAGVRGS